MIVCFIVTSCYLDKCESGNQKKMTPDRAYKCGMMDDQRISEAFLELSALQRGIDKATQLAEWTSEYTYSGNRIVSSEYIDTGSLTRRMHQSALNRWEGEGKSIKKTHWNAYTDARRGGRQWTGRKAGDGGGKRKRLVVTPVTVSCA
ncbi:hypothetical protein R3P38DRAFT_2768235 [Favolaschia claudopus]|uniref:Uncharacterized protein n=1 Tax=Favolaschia claudopus TaxID=2862362 RepID=A0AAW0CV70_9AGAR